MRRQAWLAALVLGVLAAALQVQGGAVWPAGRQGRRRGRTAHTVTTEPVQTVPQMFSSAPRVAIVNSVGFHIEVYCALLWSLQQAGGSVTLYVDPDRTHDIRAVIQTWYSQPFRNYTEIEADACQYSVIAFATWPEQHTHLMAAIMARKCPGQKFLLLVHNPDTILSPQPEELPPGPLLRASDSHLLALAPHTVAATGQALATAGIQRYVHLFVPVFPVDLTCSQRERQDSPDNCAGVENPQRAGFIMQGLFQPHRRKYTQVFSEILANAQLLNDSRFHLTLIGQGTVDLPPELASKVTKLANLDYKEYYRQIRASLAVVPAFASDVYYTKKASSSVAAAMVCGTPVLADHDLVRHYNYLSKEAVFMRGRGESEGSVMLRVLQMSPSETASRVSELSMLQDQVYARNEAVMNTILRSTLHATSSGQQ